MVPFHAEPDTVPPIVKATEKEVMGELLVLPIRTAPLNPPCHEFVAITSILTQEFDSAFTVWIPCFEEEPPLVQLASIVEMMTPPISPIIFWLKFFFIPVTLLLMPSDKMPILCKSLTSNFCLLGNYS